LLSRRGFVAGFGAASLAGCGPSPNASLGKRAIRIDVHSMGDASRLKQTLSAGSLSFLSGCELLSDDPAFGGLSAFRLLPDGQRFLAITDQAHWLTGTIVSGEDGIKAIENADIAPILGTHGEPLAKLDQSDTESLALDGDIAHIGIEVENSIYRFELGKAGIETRGRTISLPPEAASLNEHHGLEALGIMPRESNEAGALIAIAEDDPEGKALIPGFILPPNGPARRIAFLKHERFRITDLAFLPQGDLITLERSISLRGPLQMRLRRVPLTALSDSAPIEGRTIFEAEAPKPIDNFEGIAIHRDAKAGTILTMVSDNNFSIVQRTLLVQWRIGED
jgi:hypothetical protein